MLKVEFATCFHNPLSLLRGYGDKMEMVRQLVLSQGFKVYVSSKRFKQFVQFQFNILAPW